MQEKISKKSKKKDNSEEESGEDLFGDDFNKDYEKRPELDNYELDMIAENDEIEPNNYQSRLRAEESMFKRDLEKYGPIESDEDESEEKVIDIVENQDDLRESEDKDEEDEEDDIKHINIDFAHGKGPLKEYLKREGIKDGGKKKNFKREKEQKKKLKIFIIYSKTIV